MFDRVLIFAVCMLGVNAPLRFAHASSCDPQLSFETDAHDQIARANRSIRFTASVVRNGTGCNDSGVPNAELVTLSVATSLEGPFAQLPTTVVQDRFVWTPEQPGLYFVRATPSETLMRRMAGDTLWDARPLTLGILVTGESEETHVQRRAVPEFTFVVPSDSSRNGRSARDRLLHYRLFLTYPLDESEAVDDRVSMPTIEIRALSSGAIRSVQIPCGSWRGYELPRRMSTPEAQFDIRATVTREGPLRIVYSRPF